MSFVSRVFGFDDSETKKLDDMTRMQLDIAAQNTNLWNGLTTPTLEALPEWKDVNFQNYSSPTTYIPDEYRSVGELQPYLENREAFNENQFGRNEQIESLNRLKDLATDTLNDADRIALQEQLGVLDRQRQVAQNQLRQQIEDRGMGNTGQALLLQNLNNQQADASSNSLARSALAEALRRQVTANQAAGQLGSQIRQNDFQSDAFNYNALADFSNRRIGLMNQARAFNLQNQQNIANLNTQNKNQASVFNITRGDDTANKNVDINNQGQIMNRNMQNQNIMGNNSIAQNNFNNQLALVTGKGNAMNNQATQIGRNQAAEAQQLAGRDANYMGMINTGIGALSKADDIASGLGKAWETVSGWFS